MKKYLLLDDLKKIAKKIQKGHGISMKEISSGKIIKLRTSYKNVAGRTCFLFKTKSGDIIPIFLRKKDDVIGNNLSFQNPIFCQELSKKLMQIQVDLDEKNFEEIVI